MESSTHATGSHRPCVEIYGRKGDWVVIQQTPPVALHRRTVAYSFGRGGTLSVDGVKTRAQVFSAHLLSAGWRASFDEEALLFLFFAA